MTGRYYAVGLLLLMLLLAGCGGTSEGEEMASPDRTESRQSTLESDGTITVVATEMAFEMDVAAMSPGTVTFRVRNEGKTNHDFQIQGGGIKQKTAVLEPGQSESLTVELQPGRYTYRCTIRGHAAAGMAGTITVD